MSRTIWIQAHQLGRDNSALAEIIRPTGPVPPAQVLMIESEEQSRLRPYHRRKLILLFSAMRHFAEELRKRKIPVDYYGLLPDGSHPHRTFREALRLHQQKFSPAEMTMMELPELSGAREASMLAREFGIPLRTTCNTNVLTDRAAFAAGYSERQRLPMEKHYSSLRRQFRLLMDENTPAGGRWSFTPGRQTLPQDRPVPRPLSFLPDSMTSEVIRTVDSLFPDHPGTGTGFDLPVTHAQAIALLDDFIAYRLPRFGTSAETMVAGEPLLYHSFLAPFLNIGLLAPLHLLKKVEHAYHTGAAPLSSVEFFVRQILGWREYLYGIYHTFMPGYRTLNTLEAHAGLPVFFRDGSTDCACLADAITQAIRTGYLHHGYRSTIIGNFATLAGIRPLELFDWFMALFLDAWEWVTLPNVIGMGTYADGGCVTTAPSVSGGRAINRVSDYCARCRYRAGTTTGDAACPFNTLYWDFLERNRTNLSLSHGKLAAPYRRLRTMNTGERRALHQTTKKLFLRLFR